MVTIFNTDEISLFLFVLAVHDESAKYGQCL